jgi:RNA polymerase primary sigma factor
MPVTRFVTHAELCPQGKGVCMQQATESRSKGFFRSSPSTAFDQYLHDIQKLPLITDPEEERRLARRAQKGDEKAAERLVTANLRFVISYVKKYQGHGLDLSELVAIGNEGLLKAVRKFDPDQGVKFISYAVWWVRQAVLKALAEQTRSVRIPLNQNSQLIKLARAETILAQVLKRDPTEHEIGRLIEETPEAVRAAKQMSATEVSLDAPIDRSDREAATLGERFAGVDGGDIEDGTDCKLMRECIDRVFRKYLTPRERKILYLYYGLEEGSEAMTLERIGALMGVTRERIRQIRERAFEKLRESPDGRALARFWVAA